MMKSQIKKIIDNNFIAIINSIKKLEPNHKKIFHKLINKDIKASFLGCNLCGESAFVIKRLLENNKINSIVKENNKGIADYRDHVYLQINSIIVDFTWKQFLQDDRSENIECKYLQYIQYELPPYFIGTHDELYIQLDNILTKNRNEFGNINIDLHNVKTWWNTGKDVTYRFNYDKCIKNGIVDSKDILI